MSAQAEDKRHKRQHLGYGIQHTYTFYLSYYCTTLILCIELCFYHYRYTEEYILAVKMSDVYMHFELIIVFLGILEQS